MSEGDVKHLRQVRDAAHRDLSVVFAHWKANPNRAIKDWKEQEDRLAADYGKLLAPILGQLAIRHDLSVPSTCEAALAFVRSPAFAEVPFVRISSWLFATAAKKAANQKDPPNRGFLADVEAISCLLPYCDAMFLDNACRAHLDELRRGNRLAFETLIFSRSNIAEFILYLESLDQLAAPEVADLADRLYTGNTPTCVTLRA